MRVRLPTLLGVVVFAAACSAPEPGTPVTFDDFCDTKYDRPAGSDELPRVTIEGYLAPPKMFSLCSDTCSFDLYEDAEATGRSIRYSVRLGTSNNQLEPLPERFSPDDFKLHTNEGNDLGFGDKVRLTGHRLGTAAGNDCQLYKVDLIETP